MYEIEFDESLITLEPGSARALKEAAIQVRDTISFPEENWLKAWDQGRPSRWNKPGSLIEQINMLECKVEKLEVLLREKELGEAMDSNWETANRHRRVKTFSLIAALTFAFSISMYSFAGILLMNPLLCVFGIIACLMFWLMATVHERTSRS